jgi:glycosyltransferase involved in cell wall biosynthesis
MGAPIRAIYVSYDGALDPLGASQAVPYVVGLADHGFGMTLVSFEKPERWGRTDLRTRLQTHLAAHSVQWIPLRYHRRPRIAATAWDIMIGSRTIAAEASRSLPDLVHCRGDLAMAMARLAGLPASTSLLYDVRGFFSDERVETGSWRRGGLLDRAVRRMETTNLRWADGAVTLTKFALAQVLHRRPALSAHRVIPTCADLSQYRPRSIGDKPEFGLVYSGSLGTWYMAKEMATFARSSASFMSEPTLFLTPQTAEAREMGIGPDWADVRAVEPGDVAGWLRRARALFFFILPIASKRASCPTKLAEGLASGLPIVCNRGVGDLDEVLENENVGVLVDSFSDVAYARAWRRLESLLQDPGLAQRCRQLAERRYSLDLGVETYRQLYLELLSKTARQ